MIKETGDYFNRKITNGHNALELLAQDRIGYIKSLSDKISEILNIKDRLPEINRDWEGVLANDNITSVSVEYGTLTIDVNEEGNGAELRYDLDEIMFPGVKKKSGWGSGYTFEYDVSQSPHYQKADIRLVVLSVTVNCELIETEVPLNQVEIDELRAKLESGMKTVMMPMPDSKCWEPNTNQPEEVLEEVI